MRVVVLLILSLVTARTWAGLYGEFNGYFATDTFTTSSAAQYNKTFYALDLYANLENKHYLFAGFHVDQVAMTENNGTTTLTLTSMNMGPMFLWLMDKRKIFSLALGYNLVAKGSYNDGSSTAELVGTGLWSTLGAMPEIGENFYLGLKLNYYSLNYSRSIVGSASSDVAYTRTLVFPSVGFAWRY